MTLTAQYDPENIFAKIICGDTPSVKVYETDKILAFMDAFPQTRGHCLVIHKNATATNLFDINAEDLTELTLAVQKVAGAVKEGLKPDGIRIVQFNGAPAGQTVFHLHFHVIPMFEGETERPHFSGAPAPVDYLEPLAAAIRTRLDS